MLSYHAITAPQPGQAEPGRQMLRRSGTRAMTTLRKLPMSRPATTKAAIILLVNSFTKQRSRRPVLRPPGSRYSEQRLPQGQVAPPLESAAVLSPLPQTRKVPVAFSEYLYEVPEPVQAAGRVGVLFMNGPPTWFWPFVCCEKSTTGSAPAAVAVDVGQLTAAEPPGAGIPPQCAE